MFTDGLKRVYHEKWKVWRVRRFSKMLRILSFKRNPSIKGALKHFGFDSTWKCRSCGMLSQNGREKRCDSTLRQAMEGIIRSVASCGRTIFGSLSHTTIHLGADDEGFVRGRRGGAWSRNFKVCGERATVLTKKGGHDDQDKRRPGQHPVRVAARGCWDGSKKKTTNGAGVEL